MTDLSERYPTHPRRRRVVAGVMGLVALLGAVWLIWVASVRSTPDVVGRVKSFQVVSDTQVEGVLTVDRRDAAQPARCHLFSQAVNYERVGEIVLEVAPGTSRVTDVPVSMKTFRRATALVLDRCEPAR